MELLENVLGGVVEWSPTGFVAVIIYMILTDRLVTRSRLLEKIEEVMVWRSKSESEQAINQENAASLKNFADAELLRQGVRDMVGDMSQLRKTSVPAQGGED